MDDFSWGNTRVVIGDGGSKKVVMNDDERFDESMIPLKKFSGELSLWMKVFLCLYSSQSTKRKRGRVFRDTRTRRGSARRVHSLGSRHRDKARHAHRTEGITTGTRTQ